MQRRQRMRGALAGISFFAAIFMLSSLPSLRAEATRRSLISFKETIENTSFQCSTSGPCVACEYSEKNEEKYRCSETGYRIPLKCIEIGDASKEANGKKFQKRLLTMQDDIERSSYASHPKQNARKLALSIKNFGQRRLLDPSSMVEGGRKMYITYRSCMLPASEEKLSVLGFEGIMVFLVLLSGTFVHFRRKHTMSLPGAGAGAVRTQTNSRF